MLVDSRWEASNDAHAAIPTDWPVYTGGVRQLRRVRHADRTEAWATFNVNSKKRQFWRRGSTIVFAAIVYTLLLPIV